MRGRLIALPLLAVVTAAPSPPERLLAPLVELESIRVYPPIERLLHRVGYVLDTGHGGRNLSAVGRIRINGRSIQAVEKDLSHDILLRVERQLRIYGPEIYKTVTDPDQPVPIDELEIPLRYAERFTLNGVAVDSTSRGLRTRVRTANEVHRQYGDLTFFVSFHLDNSSGWRGAYLIVPKHGPIPELAQRLVEEFRREGMLRVRTKDGTEYDPVRHAGDGVRNALILRGRENPHESGIWNHVGQRVLIEFGNLNHPADVRRMLDPMERERYAQAVARVLIQMGLERSRQSQ